MVTAIYLLIRPSKTSAKKENAYVDRSHERTNLVNTISIILPYLHWKEFNADVTACLRSPIEIESELR